MKKNIQSLGWFGAWVFISIIAAAAMMLGAGSTGMWSAIIMVTLCLMPLRDWTVRVAFWAIEWAASNMREFREAIEPYMLIDSMLPGKDDKKKFNVGFIRGVKVAVGSFYGIVALMFWILQGFSSEVVYGVMHNVMTVCQHLASGSGWERASILLWLVLTTIWIAILVWFVRLFVTVGRATPKNIIVFGVAFILKRITNYVLLGYTAAMVGWNVLFWVIMIGVPVGIFFLIPVVWPLIRRLFS